jgi:hypothetical protein
MKMRLADECGTGTKPIAKKSRSRGGLSQVAVLYRRLLGPNRHIPVLKLYFVLIPLIRYRLHHDATCYPASKTTPATPR